MRDRMNAPTLCDLLIEPGFLVPVVPHGVVFEGYAVAVDAGAIVAVGPVAELRAAYLPSETLQRPEAVLIPGLINAHTHNPMTLLRGIADDLPLMEWLQGHIWPVEGAVIGPEFVRDGVTLAIAEMLRGGTTCANENYFFPDVQAETYAAHGFRAMVGLPVIDFPTAWAKTSDEYFDKALAVHAQ
ncbi:MAG: TRZ/ATZ family hydrolase, partial [Lysobacter sp.]